jgi:hypothetical protein
MSRPMALPRLSFVEAYRSLPKDDKERLEKLANRLANGRLSQNGIDGDDLLQETLMRCSAIEEWPAHVKTIAILVRTLKFVQIDALRKLQRWPASHRDEVQTDNLASEDANSPEQSFVKCAEVQNFLSGQRPDTLRLVNGLILGLRGSELFIWTGFDKRRFKSAYRDLNRKLAAAKKLGGEDA